MRTGAYMPSEFYYRYSWIVLILAILYAVLAAYLKDQAPSIFVDSATGFLLAAVYIEWKTLCVSLNKGAIQSRSLFHSREILYSDINFVQLITIPMGGRNLKISSKHGKIFRIDDSLRDFDRFVARVMSIAKDNGASLEEISK
jgi:hypothetical protein